VTKAHPTLDCVILNSGVQRSLDFSKPESIDLETAETELLTNYTSYIHLTKYFLPFLQAQASPTSLVFTTSGLALVPILRCPNYCASKAALHHLIICMREQYVDYPSPTPIPKMKQTNLHLDCVTPT
jgi:short-subunit dehydrogenase involved in D-alanine esterification of teichoic acids